MKLDTVEVKASEKLQGVLKRRYFNDKRTIGTFELYSGSERIWCLWSCYTCEDPVRGEGDPATVKEWKIKGDSAIPYGKYKVRKTWSEKYKRNMWELQNVPGYQGIRIHSGNNENHTEGCLLFGKRIGTDYKGVVDSQLAIAEFEALLASLGDVEWEIQIVKDGYGL